MNNPSEENTEVKLVAEDGCLYTPKEAMSKELRDLDFYQDNPILIVHHPEGDHDTIKWPRPNAKHLRSALFDAREQGLIPDVREVLLPNGEMFVI